MANHSTPTVLSFCEGYKPTEEVFIIVPMEQQRTHHNSDRAIELSSEKLEVEELEAPPPTDAIANRALRILARWLVSAARKGAPVADSGLPAEGQIVLDVARDTEVVSKPEAPEMPVQQAFQRGDRR